MSLGAKTTRFLRCQGRTPGEKAFDRCFLPLATLVVVGVLANFLGRSSGILHVALGQTSLASKASFIVDHAWFDWSWFALGLLLAGLWLRAFVSLVTAWNDPSAKVLRFSASVLLLPFGVVAWQLLRAPFS